MSKTSSIFNFVQKCHDLPVFSDRIEKFGNQTCVKDLRKSMSVPPTPWFGQYPIFFHRSCWTAPLDENVKVKLGKEDVFIFKNKLFGSQQG